MAWATPDDVISAWVGPEAAPDDTDQVALWIARAERRIRAAVPDIQSRIDADEPDLLENAIDVAVAMVTRVYRNPSGHRSISGQETTGQFSGSNTITFGGNNPGALELLDDERDALRPPDAPATGQAFNVSTISEGAVQHLPWCSLWFTGKWCSCGADIAGHPIYGGA